MKTFLKRASSWVVSAAISLQIFAGTGVLDVTAFAASGTVIGPYTITGGMRNIDYRLESDILHIMSDIPITIANTDINTASTVPIVVDANVDADITLAGVNIAPTNNAAIDVSPATQSKANVIITIADDTVNTLKGAGGCAALQKNGEYISENEGKLTIQGETAETGKLDATGGSGGAGIGSGKGINGSSVGGIGTSGGDSIASNIIIMSGIITALGGDYSAGIGSGLGGYGGWGSTLYNNESETYTDHGGSGGNGGDSCAINIFINGGTISASGGSNGVGIGSGSGGGGGSGGAGRKSADSHSGGDGGDGGDSCAINICINGGTILAMSKSADGVGIGSSSGGAGANGGDGGGCGSGGGGYSDGYGGSGGDGGDGGQSISQVVVTRGYTIATGGLDDVGIGSGNGGNGGNGGDGGSSGANNNNDGNGGNGGNGGQTFCKLLLQGGQIIATGGSNGIGIGSGNGGNGGNGGTGHYYGYIGNGANGGKSCVEVAISKCVITAQGNEGCAGIGHGSGGRKGVVGTRGDRYKQTDGENGLEEIIACNIEKSSLKALGSANGSYYGANIGSSATSTTDGTPYLPTDADGNSLYLAEIENPTGGPIVIDGEDYPITKHFDEAKIYVYLTDTYHTVTVGEQSYALNPRTGRMLPLPEVTAPTAVEGLVYNESDQILIEAGSTSNGTMVYALDKAGPYSEQLPTGLNANTYTVWYKSQGDDKTIASTNPASIEVIIAKAPWNFTQEQLDSITATGITYEQTLGDSVLSGDPAFAGTYAWQEPDTLPTVSDSDVTGFPIWFVPTDINYNKSAAACTLTVSKKSHTFTANDISNLTAGELVYGQTLSESTITGPTPVSGSYRWVTGNVTPTVNGTNNYSVEFVPTDIVNYEISPVGNVHVNVNKADPIITAEQLAAMRTSEITYGQSLADSVIDLEANTPGTYRWTDDTIVPTVADSLITSYSITFTPDDTDNYNVRTINAMVKVNKAPIILSDVIKQSVSATGITYEQTLADSILSGDVPQAGHWEWKEPTIAPTVSDSGTTTFDIVFVPDDPNYANAEATVTLIINKKAFAFTQADADKLSAEELTYGQTLSESIITGTTPMSGSYRWVDGDTVPTVNGTNVYSVEFVPTDTDNYEIVPVGTVHVTVNKADPIITAEQVAGISASELTYGQTLADSTITATSTTPGAFEWTDGTIAPSVSDSGVTAYNVTFTPDDADNYNSKIVTTTVVVQKAVPTVPADMLTGISATSIKFGQTLNDSALSYVGNETFDGTLVWANPEIAPAVVDSDTTEYLVTYRPADTANYKTLTFKTTVHVDKGKAPSSLTDIAPTVPATTGDSSEFDISTIIDLPDWAIIDNIVDDPHGIFKTQPTIDGETLKYEFDTSRNHQDETADVTIKIRSRDYEDFEIKLTIKATNCPHIDVLTNVGRKAATCTEEGYTGDTVCNACNCVIKPGKPIAVRAHSGIVKDSVAATCTSEGYSGDVYCKDCGAFVSSGYVTAKLSHKEGDPVTDIAATFTSEGRCSYYCTECKAFIRSDVIPKLDPNEHTHTWAADYRCDDHDHWQVCTECNGLSVKSSHHYGDSEYITATCTTEGTVKYICTVCGLTTVKTEVPGHRPVWVQSGDSHLKQCAICGERFETEQHSFSHWEEKSAPTVEHLGTYSRSCKLCGYTEETRADKTPAEGDYPSDVTGTDSSTGTDNSGDATGTDGSTRTDSSGAGKNPGKGDNPHTGVEFDVIKFVALAIVAGATMLLSRKCKI